MAAHSFDERRQNTRVMAELRLQFQRTDMTGTLMAPQRAATANVSVEGLSFYSQIDLPLWTQLRLIVAVPGSKGEEEIEIRGLVVRRGSETAGPNGYEYGVKIQQPEMAETLRRFVQAIDITKFLREALERGAESIHFTAFNPPMVRVDKSLEPLSGDALSGKAVEWVVQGVLNHGDRDALGSEKELDVPLNIPNLGRWRVNVHFQQGLIEATCRPVAQDAPSLAEANLPARVSEMVRAESGLILVTGPSDHSTGASLAAMVGVINREAARVIVTLEDRIEFVHAKFRSIVKQRELGRDVRSYADGVHSATQQDADVIVVGDIADRNTMAAVLHAVETGHLVIGAIHMPTPIDGLKRIASFYTQEWLPSELYRLSASLVGIIGYERILKETGHDFMVKLLDVNDRVRSIVASGAFEELAGAAG